MPQPSTATPVTPPQASPTPAEPATPSAAVVDPAPVASSPAAPTADDIKALPEFKAALTEEVERVFSARLGRETERIRRDLQREFTPQPASNGQPATEPSTAAATTKQERSEENLRLDFYMAVIDTPLEKPAREYLERGWLQTKGNAGTASDYISDAIRAFGGGKQQLGAQPSTTTQVVTPAAQPTIAQPNPPGPPASDRGSPTTTNDALSEQSMERWDQSHIDRFRAEAREAGESEAKYVKAKMLESLRGKTLVFSR